MVVGLLGGALCELIVGLLVCQHHIARNSDPEFQSRLFHFIPIPFLKDPCLTEPRRKD
jgi:hypothetical protein